MVTPNSHLIDQQNSENLYLLTFLCGFVKFFFRVFRTNDQLPHCFSNLIKFCFWVTRLAGFSFRIRANFGQVIESMATWVSTYTGICFRVSLNVRDINIHTGFWFMITTYHIIGDGMTASVTYLRSEGVTDLRFFL